MQHEWTWRTVTSVARPRGRTATMPRMRERRAGFSRGYGAVLSMVIYGGGLRGGRGMVTGGWVGSGGWACLA